MKTNKKKKDNLSTREFLPIQRATVKIKENEKIDKYLDLTKELKKNVAHAVDGDTNCCWCTLNGPKRLGKGVRTVEN